MVRYFLPLLGAYLSRHDSILGWCNGSIAVSKTSDGSSNLSPFANFLSGRSADGSAPHLGCGSRGFESRPPDQLLPWSILVTIASGYDNVYELM